MKLSIGKIIYVVLIGVLIFFTVKSFNQSTGAYEEAESKVVVLDSTEVLEENEGKLVLLKGKMIPKDTLKFEEYGVEVQSPVLERKVEMYQYVQEIDDNDKGIVKRVWSDDTPEEEVYDEIYKERYYNPEMRVESETLYGEAYIGNFLIDKEITKKLSTNANFTQLNAIEGYRVADGILTNSNEGWERVGDLRIQFKYLDLEKDGEYTVLGKQSGNKIVEYKLDMGVPVLKVLQGIKDKEDVLESMSQEKKRTGYILLVVLVILVLFGLLSLRRGSKGSSVEVSSTVEKDTEEDLSKEDKEE